MSDTYYTATLSDDREVTTGSPQATYSGKGPYMIPILIVRTASKGDVVKWLPLTATAEEQQAAVDAVAKNEDAEMNGAIDD